MKKTAGIILDLVRPPLILPLLEATIGLGESLFLLIFLLGMVFVSIVMGMGALFWQKHFILPLDILFFHFRHFFIRN
jgi:hypothetical protein